MLGACNLNTEDALRLIEAVRQGAQALDSILKLAKLCENYVIVNIADEALTAVHDIVVSIKLDNIN